MFTCWSDLTMLLLESQRVIGLRAVKAANGGPAAMSEALLMVSEKIEAATQASKHLMMGGTSDSMVREYRKLVHANALRLSA